MASSDDRRGERILDVKIDDEAISVRLADGRTVSAPLAWFPRLLHATPRQRRKWELCAGGFGVHWPEIDEDVSAEGLLRGAPAAG